MKYWLILAIFVGSLFNTTPLKTEMSGGDFEIYADAISATGGAVSSSGGNFSLFETGGEFFATSTNGGSFELKGGFQAMEQGILSISLDEASISFGTLSQSSVSSDSIVATINTNSATGYALTLTEDGNLRVSDAIYIDDVTDGEVTAGSEEYGVRVSGADASLPVGQDEAINTSPGLTVASNAGFATDSQVTVEFRASIGSSSRAGNYSHDVVFTIVANP